MMNFRDALGFLLSLPDSERGTGKSVTKESLFLERPAALLAALGNPQQRFRSVLIAGTKGKGSTAAMLESILRAAGISTGFYSSPHLHTYRERVRTNGALISEPDFAARVEQIQPLLVSILTQHPEYESFTTFEVLTALALYHFAQSDVEVAILEVGMGGRLDATNVVDADLSIITPISFDHTAVFGNTLTKIATEKAGIIKAGKIVVSAPQTEEALHVIDETAQKRNARLVLSGRDWLWLGGHHDHLVWGKPYPDVWKDYWTYRDLRVPLRGVHQLENSAVAVAAARIIQERWGLPLGPTAVSQGLASTEWAGRLEVLQSADSTHPLIIADGAHNGDSAEKLLHALKFHFQFDKLYLIFGVLQDKNLEAIIQSFAPVTEFVWTLKTSHPRARDARSIATIWNASGIPASAASNFDEALQNARDRARPNDLILITGSLSVVAQAHAAFGLVQAQDPPLS